MPAVRRPARYTGGEWNARAGDWEQARLRIALAYPDLYEIGMANLGLLILYDRLNRTPGVLADRLYAPWPDMEALLRRDGMPLFGLETRQPLAEFDILGFSLAYELTCTNLLTMLDLAGIPLLAAERSEDDPLVIAGGSMAYNPAPVDAFVDLVVVGEGEEAMDDLATLWMETRGQGRTAFLRRAAQLPGIYVPRFYQVRYHDDGTIAAIRPTEAGIPEQVVKRVLPDLSLSPPVTRPVVPYVASVHDRAVIEIQRGCSRGCRFCQAGIVYRPARERPHEEVLAAVRELLAHTGYEELSLLSFSSSDYSGIADLLTALAEEYASQGLSLALPSLRLDSFAVELAEVIAQRRRTGLTFAPEAGTQRLRDVVNKGLDRGDLTATMEAAFSRGWQRVKLYFLVGLPTETQEDLAGIVAMVQEALRIGRQYAGRRARIAVSVNPLVPKPHTPFQWLGQPSANDLAERIAFLRRELRSRAIEFSWPDLATSRLEAALARGDRRLGPVILEAWRNGARFDAWPEQFDPQRWWAAFQAAGLDPDFYINRSRPFEEILPWDTIHCGVSKTFLWKEYRRALRGEPTPDCRAGRCSGCGVFQLVPCPQLEDTDTH